ncbi:double zinc ribbon domain-containing protein [Papillibacter cinnamivorans]|uniref:DZANK-type domain-containing protein n=1 Tax=Papillibacter cinnamivorans DSM 12816 TaxID=1122930 RepID=A0A1W1ZI59_9FIRM|nr:zinc ribbon domain-containing protein [Papillibacter cinnamivorans]SMC48057.1 hypothetical protein SAMN02745168_1125 [Papillibacter cinnamivorans DSM 12816]
MPDLIRCPACNAKVPADAQVCRNCGNIIGELVCPKCGSKETEKLQGMRQAAYAVIFGSLNSFRAYHCRSCGKIFRPK